MKTKLRYELEPDFNEKIVANKRAALDVFKNKLPEPLKSLLICRDPTSLETAIQILHENTYIKMGNIQALIIIFIKNMKQDKKE